MNSVFAILICLSQTGDVPDGQARKSAAEENEEKKVRRPIPIGGDRYAWFYRWRFQWSNRLSTFRKQLVQLNVTPLILDTDNKELSVLSKLDQERVSRKILKYKEAKKYLKNANHFLLLPNDPNMAVFKKLAEKSGFPIAERKKVLFVWAFQLRTLQHLRKLEKNKMEKTSVSDIRRTTFVVKKKGKNFEFEVQKIQFKE